MDRGLHGARRSNNWQGAPTTAEWQAIGNTTRHGYTSHEMLDNVELVHMNGRVFDPAIGRFLSADPFIDGAYSTQGWNRYAYVHGRLMSATDPSGFSSSRPRYWNGIEGVTTEASRLWGWLVITDPLAIGNIQDQLSPLATASGTEGTITADGIEGVVVEGSTVGGDDVRCTPDPVRSAAIAKNPHNPDNLAPGKYPTKAMTFSASAPLLSLLAIGVGGENRYLADFGTATIHVFTTFSPVVGFDYGASMQFAGGVGNRNYTILNAPGSALTGFGVTGSLDLVLLAGGGVSTNLYPTSTYSTTTTTIGFGADLGVSVAPGVTQYQRAIPVGQASDDLRQFYFDVWNRECGAR